jgi:hypothetical protein
MIVSSQIGRELEVRGSSEKRPNLNDLSINDSLFSLKNLGYVDELTFLYCDHYYNPTNPNLSRLVTFDYNFMHLSL